MFYLFNSRFHVTNRLNGIKRLNLERGEILMKKIFLISVFCIALFAYALPVRATYINYLYNMDDSGTSGVTSDDTMTTQVSFAIVDTFDSTTPAGWTYSSNDIVNGTVSGSYAAPYISDASVQAPDATDYFVVPLGDSTNTVEVSFGGEKYNYLGLLWGSIDSYNSIKFYDGDTLLETWTGSNLPTPAVTGGSQNSANSNLYVNFYDLPEFDRIELISTSKAFEIDNLAVALVPVPATILLGFLGLGIGGWKLRKSI